MTDPVNDYLAGIVRNGGAAGRGSAKSAKAEKGKT